MLGALQLRVTLALPAVAELRVGALGVVAALFCTLTLTLELMLLPA